MDCFYGALSEFDVCGHYEMHLSREELLKILVFHSVWSFVSVISMSQADLKGSYTVLADSVCTSHHFRLNHSTTVTLLEAQTGFFLICLHAYLFISYGRKTLKRTRWQMCCTRAFGACQLRFFSGHLVMCEEIRLRSIVICVLPLQWQNKLIEPSCVCMAGGDDVLKSPQEQLGPVLGSHSYLNEIYVFRC